jgi:nucleoside-diphosphate-sugar epimerase
MQVLVTGGAGFIGSFLADRLLTTGHQVRLLDNLDPRVHPYGRPSYLDDVLQRSFCLGLPPSPDFYGPLQV